MFGIFGLSVKINLYRHARYQKSIVEQKGIYSVIQEKILQLISKISGLPEVEGFCLLVYADRHKKDQN